MQSIIWAFGATLVLSLAVSIIPLGFTLRGKFIVVFTSFLIALGGTAATQSVSIWLTSALLLVLILVLSYLFDQRLGRMIFKTESNGLEEFNEEETVKTNFELGTSKEYRLEVQEESSAALENAFISNQKVTNDSIKKLSLQDDTNDSAETVMPEADLDHLLNPEGTSEENEPVTERENEDGYLADIEHWIEVEADSMSNKKINDFTKETIELSPINLNKNSQDNPSESEDALLDDSLFEILLASEEAAASKEADLPKAVLKK